MSDYHSRFLALVDEIEQTFPVADWMLGDVPIWPLARGELYLALYWQSAGYQPSNPKRSLIRDIARAADYAATPMLNLWRSRSDLFHFVTRPRRADALFLGDGACLDLVDGAWHDRFCEPLIEMFERNGRTGFLMQQRELRRLPWHRPTFAANTIDRWARLGARAARRAQRLRGQLPQHDRLLTMLADRAVPAERLAETVLRNSAAVIAATADRFESLLKIVRPSICFMVTYYAGMGHALALACRRRGVLSVDLQHDPHEDGHEAYRWLAVPSRGYGVLPAVFWTWTARDAAAIDRWSGNLSRPWHRSVHGGHPQLSSWFDDNDERTRAYDAKVAKIREQRPARLEILVALQSVHGYDEIWNALARVIETSPADWRWWLRRHPSAPEINSEALARLVSLKKPNVLCEAASSLPLPALLRHMDVVLSLKSGAGVEAAMFGVQPIFLSRDASSFFPALFARGEAEIIDNPSVLKARLTSTPLRKRSVHAQPSLKDVVRRLQALATDYAKMCEADRS